MFIWGGFILGMVALLGLLAKLGSSTTSSGQTGAPLKTAMSETDWVKGSATAPHTIVEYSDFQCPSCGSYYPLLKRLAEEHGDQVRVAYRHFPLEQIHNNARVAARAAEAAGRQGKFFEMHDALFNTQDNWSTDSNPSIFFEDLSASIGLDSAKFKADFKDSRIDDKINSDLASGRASGVNATPSLFFDGKLINNPNSYEELVRLVTTASEQK